MALKKSKMNVLICYKFEKLKHTESYLIKIISIFAIPKIYNNSYVNSKSKRRRKN